MDTLALSARKFGSKPIKEGGLLGVKAVKKDIPIFLECFNIDLATCFCNLGYIFA